MRLVLFTFPIAIVVGYVLGGRLGNLANTRFRFGWIGLLGVALQFLPLEGTLGYLALVGSLILLLFVASANWRLPGFVLVLAGLWLNFIVITVNEGMPVTREAIVASGQAETISELHAGEGGSKHHIATSDDTLLILADRIAIPPPVKQAISVGDVVAYSGAMWFVIEGMRRRTRDEADRELSVAGASA
jgi:hypothetical protein